MTTWIDEEFEDISFGDSRLNDRFLKVAERFLEKPSSSVSESSGSWAESKANYRFFENEKVTKAEILRPHVVQTMKRISDAKQTVLAIQDTTYLDYTHHPRTQGLGKLTRPSKTRPPLMGLVLHNTLAVTAAGECLGLLNQKIYRRSDEDLNKTQNNKKRPIEKKESYRWIEVVKQVNSTLLQASNIVYVCDREGDIFEFFSEVAQQSQSNFLVRAAKDRLIGERYSYHSSTQNKNTTLWQFMQTQEVLGSIEINIPKRSQQAKRTALCEVRVSLASIPPPYRLPEARSKDLLKINIYVIWIKEVGQTTGVDPIEWMLLTNIPTHSLEEACEKMSWYKARWHIENYHKVLKSGCNVEKSRLNHADKLEKFSTLMSVIAARVYQLKLTGRENPTTPCTNVLSEDEWRVLHQFVNKTKNLPDQPPTTKEVMLWIAKLGGFLGRKSDGNPGSIVIWRGWQRFMDIMETWRMLQPTATCG